MGFKMSVPYLGLTRKPGEKGKHKANVRAICLEAGYERVGESRTLDRTLSDQNVYVGYESGNKLADFLEERADEYRVKVNGKRNGKEVTYERPLRKDAIIGFAVIWKPPAEVVAEWDTDTRERFFADCYAVAEELEPELFRPSNLLMKARHKDEKLHGGDEHEHAVGIPLTSDGRYNGSDMLNHMRRNFNKNFAGKMRERGWDMEDLELYDPERAKVDEAYRAYRRDKRSRYGKSVNEHAADEAEERAAKMKEIEAEAQANAAKALAEQQAAESARREEEEKRDAVKAEAQTEADRILSDAQESARETRTQARDEADSIIDSANKIYDRADAREKKVDEELEKARDVHKANKDLRDSLIDDSAAVRDQRQLENQSAKELIHEFFDYVRSKCSKGSKIPKWVDWFEERFDKWCEGRERRVREEHDTRVTSTKTLIEKVDVSKIAEEVYKSLSPVQSSVTNTQEDDDEYDHS